MVQQLDIHMWKKKVGLPSYTANKINLNRYLKVFGKNTTLLEENTLGSLYNFGLCNDFLVMTLKAQVGKEK